MGPPNVQHLTVLGKTCFPPVTSKNANVLLHSKVYSFGSKNTYRCLLLRFKNSITGHLIILVCNCVICLSLSALSFTSLNSLSRPVRVFIADVRSSLSAWSSGVKVLNQVRSVTYSVTLLPGANSNSGNLKVEMSHNFLPNKHTTRSELCIK